MTDAVQRRRSLKSVEPFPGGTTIDEGDLDATSVSKYVKKGETADAPFVPTIEREGSFRNSRHGSFRGKLSLISRENSFANSINNNNTEISSAIAIAAAAAANSGQDIGNKHSTREHAIVNASKAARRRLQGRDITSVIMNPSRKGGEAPSERGPTLLTQHIVLGGRDESNDFELLKKLGITHILNVASSLPNCFEDSFIYMSVPLHDTVETNIVDFMPSINTFLSHVEQLNGRVLVHCISGVSRSVTVTVLHLIMVHGMLLSDAYKYVSSYRPWIGPNDGFKLQMAQTELKVLSVSSVCGPQAGKEWDFYLWNAIRQTIHSRQVNSGVRIVGRRSVLERATDKADADTLECCCTS